MAWTCSCWVRPVEACRGPSKARGTAGRWPGARACGAWCPGVGGAGRAKRVWVDLGWPVIGPGRDGLAAAWAGLTELGQRRILWRKAADREKEKDGGGREKRKERKRKKKREKGWFRFENPNLYSFRFFKTRFRFYAN